MTNNTIYGKLAVIRKTNGLTQTEVSKRSGLTQPVIARLEAGKIFTPRVASMKAYLEAIGVPYDKYQAMLNQEIRTAKTRNDEETKISIVYKNADTNFSNKEKIMLHDLLSSMGNKELNIILKVAEELVDKEKVDEIRSHAVRNACHLEEIKKEKEEIAQRLISISEELDEVDSMELFPFK